MIKNILLAVVFILTQHNLYSDSKNNLQFVKNIDSTLYIASKYNSSYDLISIWEKCMANELFTFKTIALYANASDTINENVTRPHSILILSSAGTDNIGPITFNNALVGENHTFTDSLGVIHKTAKTIKTEIFYNDSLLIGDFNLYSDEIKIMVVNNLFNASDLPVENTHIVETVEYSITPNTINIRLQHDIEEDLYINSYYGMQSAYRSNQEKVYLPNSIYENEIDMGYGINSGIISDYPDVYKILFRNVSYTICQELFLNPNEGLFANTDLYISSTSSFHRIYTKINLLKTYYTQIRNKSVLKGDSFYWKGSYAWYDLNSYTLIPPPNLRIDVCENGVNLFWDNSVGATHYEVYRSSNPDCGWEIIGTTGRLLYIDETASSNNKYFYRVKSVNSLQI